MKRLDKEHILIHSAIMALIIIVLYNVSIFMFSSYGRYVEKKVVTVEKRDVSNAPSLGTDKTVGTRIYYFVANFVQHFTATFILLVICMSILFKLRASAGKKTALMSATCIVWVLIYSLIFISLKNTKAVADTSALVFIRLFLAMAALLSSLLYYYVTKDHEQAIENEKLRSMYYSTQYEALRSKLDPHFLFNALNTLSGLIAINSDRTKEYIQKLSTIFRITLKHEEVAPLEDELRFASSYGDLMTIRYEDALQITYQIPDDMKQKKVVSFSIQSLLENAIKHNTITKRLPMHIEIRTEGDYVVVSNPIHPRKETEESNGLGLKMLSERSTTLLKKDIVIDNDNDTFTVKIPTA